MMRKTRSAAAIPQPTVWWCLNTLYNSIGSVRVGKWTDKSVWICGKRERRELRKSQFETYYQTFEEARTAAIKRAKSDVEGLNARLATVRESLAMLEEMQEPKE